MGKVSYRNCGTAKPGHNLISSMDTDPFTRYSKQFCTAPVSNGKGVVQELGDYRGLTALLAPQYHDSRKEKVQE